MENARLLSELRESLGSRCDQRVLSTISRSSVELDTVLNTLVETVGRLCRADQPTCSAAGRICISGRVAWRFNETREYSWPILTPGRAHSAVLMDGGRSTFPMCWRTRIYLSEGQKIAGFRTMLGIPLMREDAISACRGVAHARRAVLRQGDALATGFADQAVIADRERRLFES